MPVIPVRELHKGGGVNKDAQANALALSAFSELINGRFTASRIERIGDTEIYQDALDSYASVLTDARAFFSITRAGNEGHLLITSDSVYYDIGSGWIDVTPSYSVLNDSPEWSCEQYGDSVIITSIGNEPYVLAPGAIEFAPFLDWNPNYESGRIFAYKNFLIAVDIVDTGDPISGKIIWSDAVIDGNVIGVEWTNLATNLAGENILPDASGVVLDGGVLKDSAILYTESTVWRMDAGNAVAGLTPLVFNFRRMFADDGILRKRCFVEVEGKHFVIGLNDIYVHDGFTKQTISHNRINRFFYGRLGTEGYAYVIHYPKPQEVIFAYASREFTQANEAIIFNYQYNTWVRWTFSDTEGTFKYLAVAALFNLDVESWETLPGTWQDYQNTSWNELFPSARTKVLYGLNAQDDELYVVDTDTAYNRTPNTLLIEHIDIDLKEVDGESSHLSYLHRMVPMVQGEGTFRVQFGGRNNLGESIRWSPFVTFTIGEDYKIDSRVTYRYLAFRIEQDSDEGFLSLTGFDLHAKSKSQR